MDQKKLIKAQALEDVITSSNEDRITVRDLVSAMDSIGFGLVMLIFSFGITVPLPPPFPSIISIPLVLFSIQMFLGYKSPKLPKKFSNLTVKRQVASTLVQKSLFYTGKAEKILKPRLEFMFCPNGERVIGLFILIFSSFILLPMPLSNFIPGVGILVMSLGLLSKDGVALICGIIIGLIGIIISTTLTILGFEFMAKIIEYCKELFFLI